MEKVGTVLCREFFLVQRDLPSNVDCLLASSCFSSSYIRLKSPKQHIASRRVQVIETVLLT